MNDIALIAAVLTLLAALIGLVREYFAVRPLVPTSSDRISALRGTWIGRVNQPDHPTGLTTSKFTMSLRARGRRVEGTMHLVATKKAAEGSPSAEIALDLSVKGGFVRESILRLEYANGDRMVLQFGTMYFALDATARTLKGRFSGYGQFAEGIVHGTCECTRQA